MRHPSHAGAALPPDLRITFTKRPDGAAILRCTRADGSAVWQRHEGRNAFFFPFHDLTHLAVERTLGFRQGFFGLIADGWEIADTEGRGTRGPLPPEALIAEQLVGLFDRERVGGASPLSADEFNAQFGAMLVGDAIGMRPTFSDTQITTVRADIDALHGRWAALAPGATLELDFVKRDLAETAGRGKMPAAHIPSSR